MALVVYTPREKKYGFGPQTAWGTLLTASSNYVQLDCEPTNIKPDVKVRDINVSAGTRKPYATSVALHQSGSMPTVEWKADAKLLEFDRALYAFFQSVSEGASTPYGKTFTLGDTQPDFTVNAGYFLTFAEYWPANSGAALYIGDCIGEKLTVTMEPGGLLQYALTLKGRKSTQSGGSVTLSGTWTSEAQTFFEYSQVDVCTFNDGSSLTLTPAGNVEFSLERSIVGVGSDGAGNFQTFGLTDYKIGCKVSCLNTATVWDRLYDAHTGNTYSNFRIGWGNATPGTVTGDLDFSLNGKVTAVSDPNDDISTIEFEMTGLDGTSGQEPITVVIANAVDRAW